MLKYIFFEARTNFYPGNSRKFFKEKKLLAEAKKGRMTGIALLKEDKIYT
jgi:hypothetical protein